MEPQRHLIVFDVNVYLDVGRLLGPPFTWKRFNDAVVEHRNEPRPSANRRINSLRAIASCTSGELTKDQPLEVWTCAHIDATTRHKAAQPVDPSLPDRDRGLGWSVADANTLLDLIRGITKRSGGGTLGTTLPEGEPPLDHEDALVYGACRALGQTDLLAECYCITNDTGILDNYGRDRLAGHTRVVTPAAWIAFAQKQQTLYGIRKLRRG